MSLIQTKIAVDRRVALARLGHEAVLLHTDTGVYFGLDEVGTVIWELLDKGSTEDSIHDRLVATYDADPDVLRADLSRFLEQLEARSLISRAVATAARS